jgi:hypothetical protein
LKYLHLHEADAIEPFSKVLPHSRNVEQLLIDCCLEPVYTERLPHMKLETLTSVIIHEYPAFLFPGMETFFKVLTLPRLKSLVISADELAEDSDFIDQDSWKAAYLQLHTFILRCRLGVQLTSLSLKNISLTSKQVKSILEVLRSVEHLHIQDLETKHSHVYMLDVELLRALTLPGSKKKQKHNTSEPLLPLLKTFEYHTTPSRLHEKALENMIRSRFPNHVAATNQPSARCPLSPLRAVRLYVYTWSLSQDFIEVSKGKKIDYLAGRLNNMRERIVSGCGRGMDFSWFQKSMKERPPGYL